jgi:hypothetical protein
MRTAGPRSRPRAEAFDLRDGLGYSAELYRPTVSLRLGGTPSSHLRLGGEILGWIDDQCSRTELLASLLFIAQLYPATSTGLYLKGGLGLGRNQVECTSHPPSIWSSIATPGAAVTAIGSGS